MDGSILQSWPLADTATNSSVVVLTINNITCQLSYQLHCLLCRKALTCITTLSAFKGCNNWAIDFFLLLWFHMALFNVYSTVTVLNPKRTVKKLEKSNVCDLVENSRSERAEFEGRPFPRLRRSCLINSTDGLQIYHHNLYLIRGLKSIFCTS